MNVRYGLWFLNLLIFCLYRSDAKLVLFQKPDYLELADNGGSIKLSEVEHLLSDLFGFTTHKEIGFKGFIAPPPFHSLRASAIITVFGQDALRNVKGPSIETNADDFVVSTHKLEHNLRHFYRSDDQAGCNILKLQLDSKISDLDGILENLKTDSETTKDILQKFSMYVKLNESNEEIDSYLRQVSLMLQAMDALNQNGAGSADLLTFDLNMPKASDDATANAMDTMLSQLLLQIKKVMTGLYGDDSLILVVNWSDYQTLTSRKTRSLMEAAANGNSNTTLNLADAWTSDYPAIFNIILWLMVSLILLVIYVVHGFFTMDPGSDSIIYRMTNPRIKKDN